MIFYFKEFWKHCMFIVVTEILVIVHCLRLKTTQCFRAWSCPNLQVNQEEARTYVGRPLKNSWSHSLCFWHVFTTVFVRGLKVFVMISPARFSFAIPTWRWWQIQPLKHCGFFCPRWWMVSYILIMTRVLLSPKKWDDLNKVKQGSTNLRPM